MELQGVVGTQRNIQPSLEEVRQRISFVGKEERVVTERTHRNANLLEIEEVLQCGNFAKQDSVGDRVRCQKGRCQMVSVTSFTAVWPKYEGIWNKSSFL